ncbi:MAG: MFS transporter, partial [Cytophagales bacterium]|nr:MFS transporter [Cytophagales bacterium]
ENLTKNIGLEGTMVSIGFVVGPMLAGGLIILLGVEGEESIIPLIVLGLSLSLLNIFLCYLFKETNNHLNKGKFDFRSTVNPLSNFREFLTLKTKNRLLYRLLILNACLVLTLGYYHYYVTFISLGELSMSPKEISFFFTYMGLISIIVSYIFYTKLAHRVNPTRFISIMALIGVLVLLSYTFIGASKVLIYVVVTIDCLTLSLIPGVLESQIGDQATKENRGKIFGINQMISSLSSIVTAVVFGLLTIFSIELPFYWFAICLVSLVFTNTLVNTRQKTTASSV